MRQFIQATLAVWFAVSVMMTQSCVAPSQTANSYPSARALPTSSGGENTLSSSNENLPTEAAGSSRDSHLDASGYTTDEGESRALTDYLKHHKLPLVGAQVLKSSEGRRAVVLYGFVGSDFGKSDAAAKAQRYLSDDSAQIDNRIKLRPELLATNKAPAPAAAPSASTSPDNSGYPGPESYAEQQNNQDAVTQYQQRQNSTAAVSSIVPLVALLGILGMGLAGGGGNFSMGPPSFGTTPYSPYPGYGYPFSGSPYGASPYGGSPFGASPYGAPSINPYYP
jgi:hypothetical protein